MKKIILILAATALTASCFAQKSGRTIASGKVIQEGTPRVYLPLVQDFTKEGDPFWAIWEPWALQDTYNVAAYPGDTVRAMWIDALTSDTLATLIVVGGEKKHVKTDIIFNGEIYTVK